MRKGLIPKNRMLRQRIARRFLFSYVIVFLTPLLLAFGYLFASSQRTLTAQMGQSQRMAVNQFAELFEGEMAKLRSTSLLIHNNLYLDSLLHAEPEALTNYQYLEIVQFGRDLANIATQQPHAKTLYVYLDSLDRCMLRSSYLVSASAFRELHEIQQEALTYDEWIAKLRENHRAGLWSVPHEGTDALDRRSLYFLQSLPMLPPTAALGTLVVQWDTEYLLSLMGASILDERTTLAVVDASGQVLLCNRPALPMPVDPEQFAGADTRWADRYAVAYQWSGDGKRLFLSMQPSALILRPLRIAQTASAIVLTACVVLGMALTYGFTLRNFNPIEELLTLARRLRGQRGREEAALEYSDISLALMEALDQRATVESLDQFIQELARANALLQALRAPEADEGRVLALLGAWEPDFSRGACVALRVQMTDYTQGFFQERSLTDELFHFLMILRDVFVQELRPLGAALPLVQDDGLYLFLDVSGEGADREAILERAQEAERFLRDNYVLDCETQAGRPVRAQTLPSLLRGALLAIAAREEPRDALPARMDACLREGDAQGAQRCVDEAAAICGEGERRAALLALAAPFLRGEEDGAFWAALRACECAKDLEGLLRSRAGAGGDRSATAEGPEDSREEEPSEALLLKQRAIRLVNECYTDPELNVSAIAERLGVEVTSLSRAFKQTTFIGLLDYIHHTRIKAARQLLLSQESLPLQQVGQRVGYTNVDSFIRAFKRIMNTTPGKYRDAGRQAEIDQK